MGEKVAATRSLFKTGLPVDEGEEGTVVLAPTGGRLLVDFGFSRSGWVYDENLEKVKAKF